MPQEPTNSNSDITADDLRDRLVDRALADRLAGDTPPDLTARILAAAEPSSLASSLAQSHGDTTMDSLQSARRSSTRSWALAASLLVNVGVVAMLMSSRDTSPIVAINERPTGVETASRTEPPFADTQDPIPQENVDFESNIDLLHSTVTPDTWTDEKESPTNPSLENSQTQVAHDQRKEEPGKVGLAEVGALDEESWEGVTRKLAPPKPPTQYAREAGEGQASDSSSDDQSTSMAVKVKVTTGSVLPFEAQDLEVPHRSNSFRLAELPTVESIAPMESLAEQSDPSLRFESHASNGRGLERGEAKQFYYEPMYSKLADARGRATWGFRSKGGRNWPGGDSWNGSPNGEGIGPDAAGDQYDRIHENAFIVAIGGEAVSTFSIDVDTASYANVRQMLRNSQVPPADAVRLEEFVNYFDYDYKPPTADEARRVDPFGPKTDEPEAPFAAHVETAACPWQPAHRLVRIGIKGRELAPEKRPLSNLVFLVDVSGSMNEADKLPLVVHGLKKLTQQLGENDRVAMVVYASSEGLVLPSTPGTEKETILAALDSLAAGGSTAGGAGIQLAYQIAQDNFIEGGTNRVILCTDGDFNVGTTSTAELERMVEQKAKETKVFLSCIGFGRGNLNDAMMEKITGIGNGNYYYYADGEQESERIFVKGMTGMLVTIAKDVKIQVEFNPAKVAGYRLLGYENRMLATQDFNDDKKDAGEIGAGHTVTCLYEIVPAGEEVEAAQIDEMKYQRPAGLTDEADTDELLTLKMRYKKPDGDTSTKLEWPVSDSGHKFGEASQDMQFAAAVASFGMLLRDSKYKGDTNYDSVIEIAESAKGKDPEGERAEFVELVRAAKQLKPVVMEEKEEAATEKE